MLTSIAITIMSSFHLAFANNVQIWPQFHDGKYYKLQLTLSKGGYATLVPGLAYCVNSMSKQGEVLVLMFDITVPMGFSS